MCFGSRASSVFSTSSSSSDDYNARTIDVPTVRRLNSPRCAPRGAAYSYNTQAASDNNRIHGSKATSTGNATKQIGSKVTNTPAVKGQEKKGDASKKDTSAITKTDPVKTGEDHKNTPKK